MKSYDINKVKAVMYDVINGIESRYMDKLESVATDNDVILDSISHTRFRHTAANLAKTYREISERRIQVIQPDDPNQLQQVDEVLTYAILEEVRRTMEGLDQDEKRCRELLNREPNVLEKALGIKPTLSQSEQEELFGMQMDEERIQYMLQVETKEEYRELLEHLAKCRFNYLP